MHQIDYDVFAQLCKYTFNKSLNCTPKMGDFYGM